MLRRANTQAECPGAPRPLFQPRHQTATYRLVKSEYPQHEQPDPNQKGAKHPTREDKSRYRRLAYLPNLYSKRDHRPTDQCINRHLSGNKGNS